MRKKKKISVIILILILAATASIAYLNKVFLPKKVKFWVIDNIEKAIQRKVSLESLEFNIFKGLVVKNLIVFDGKDRLIDIREASCNFILPAIFKKNIVIPSLVLRDPYILVERRSDQSINLLELLPQKTANAGSSGFKVFVYRLSIVGGRIDFKDDALSPPFSKSIDNLNLVVVFAVPDNLKFNLKAEIQGKSAADIAGTGNFKFATKQLNAKITIRDFPLQDLCRYFNIEGVYINGGLVDAAINLSHREGIFAIDGKSQIKNLNIRRDKILANLNSGLKLDLRYDLNKKELSYAGGADISRLDIQGLEFVGKLDEINGQVSWDNFGLTAHKLRARLAGQPLEARLDLKDFKNPVLNIRIVSTVSLDLIQRILSDKFNFSIPAKLNGSARLDLSLATSLPVIASPQIKGFLDITDADMRLDRMNYPFEDIKGRLDFTQDKLIWSGFNFKYQDTIYKTKGELINFSAPQIHFNLSSPELALESDLSVKDRLVSLKDIRGSYLQSAFNLSGIIDTAAIDSWNAELGCKLEINLDDLKVALKNYNKQLEQIKPSGRISAQLNLEGDLKDIKSCAIQAGFFGNSLSAYGLKIDRFDLGYRQAAGLAEIPSLKLSLYGGGIDSMAKMNLQGDNFPYTAELNIEGIKIEQLKLDTPMKGKDISGTIHSQAKINGFAKDAAKISGIGKILINDGRLWQLDLFKGLGELLFSRDFGNIVFNEGYCDFLIKDRAVFSDNLKLKSNLLGISGGGKIGFDGSLDAALNVQVNDGFNSEPSMIKNIATTLLGEAGRFAVIKLSGTLQKPKYRLQPAVVDVVKGLRNLIIKNIGN
ncbi:DUF748 domain-containing protein [bacterium]|nr:MAG: DUF748 domain-containing protein [bacterium]